MKIDVINPMLNTFDRLLDSSKWGLIWSIIETIIEKAYSYNF